MGRNHLAGPLGDAANAVLAVVGYNFAASLAWLRLWLSGLVRLLTSHQNETAISQAA